MFGPVSCNMSTIEWQTRGLPHAHILICLTTKLNVTENDKFISAEF